MKGRIEKTTLGEVKPIVPYSFLCCGKQAYAEGQPTLKESNVKIYEMCWSCARIEEDFSVLCKALWRISGAIVYRLRYPKLIARGS